MASVPAPGTKMSKVLNSCQIVIDTVEALGKGANAQDIRRLCVAVERAAAEWADSVRERHRSTWR